MLHDCLFSTVSVGISENGLQPNCQHQDGGSVGVWQWDVSLLTWSPLVLLCFVFIFFAFWIFPLWPSFIYHRFLFLITYTLCSFPHLQDRSSSNLKAAFREKALGASHSKGTHNSAVIICT